MKNGMQKVNDIVLDTHILIWLLNSDKKISLKIVDYCTKVSKSNFLLISAISIWEIAMLEKKKRISFFQPISQWVEEVLSLPYIRIVELRPQIAIESCNLPGEFHGDPADRIIIATARILNVPLVTMDRKIIAYSKKEYIRTIS